MSGDAPQKPATRKVIPPKWERKEYRAAVRHLKKMQRKDSKAYQVTMQIIGNEIAEEK